MRWVDTGRIIAIRAIMADIHLRWNGAMGKDIGGSMGRRVHALELEMSITIFVFVPLPDPACFRRGLQDSCPEQICTADDSQSRFATTRSPLEAIFAEGRTIAGGLCTIGMDEKGIAAFLTDTGYTNHAMSPQQTVKGYPGSLQVEAGGTCEQPSPLPRLMSIA